MCINKQNIHEVFNMRICRVNLLSLRHMSKITRSFQFFFLHVCLLGNIHNLKAIIFFTLGLYSGHFFYSHIHSYYCSPCRHQCSSQGSQHKTCSQWSDCSCKIFSCRQSGRWDSPRPVSVPVRTATLLQTTGYQLESLKWWKVQSWICRLKVLQFIPYLSCPYPAMLQWNPAGSWVWDGGRQTVRADGDCTAHLPSLDLIFSSAEM